MKRQWQLYCNVSDPVSWTYFLYVLYGKKDHGWQRSIIQSPRHCSQVQSSALSAVFITIFSRLRRLNSLEWEQKLQLISQQDLSENSNTFRQNYSRFPSEACWSFSPCPAEACGSWLTSRCVPENVPEKKEERKTGDYISTVPLEQQRSFFCPAASAETSSQQTDSSMFRNHNAAHCTLFVYLNPGPRFPRLCHHLYPKTERAWK